MFSSSLNDRLTILRERSKTSSVDLKQFDFKTIPAKKSTTTTKHKTSPVFRPLNLPQYNPLMSTIVYKRIASTKPSFPKPEPHEAVVISTDKPQSIPMINLPLKPATISFPKPEPHEIESIDTVELTPKPKGVMYDPKKDPFLIHDFPDRPFGWEEGIVRRRVPDIKLNMDGIPFKNDSIRKDFEQSLIEYKNRMRNKPDEIEEDNSNMTKIAYAVGGVSLFGVGYYFLK